MNCVIIISIDNFDVEEVQVVFTEHSAPRTKKVSIAGSIASYKLIEEEYQSSVTIQVNQD